MSFIFNMLQGMQFGIAHALTPLDSMQPCVSQDSQVKRKTFIALLVLIAAVVSTIAVRADLYADRGGAAPRPQNGVSSPPVISSVFYSYIRTREEVSYLVLEGGIFLVLGSLSLRRARRQRFMLEARSSGGTD
jgi:hypothetical protein